MKTIIIAEAGVNHNGDMGIARSLIDVAAEAGVDYIKFQTYNADKIVKKDSIRAEYQIKNTATSETQYEMLKRLELSKKMHIELIEHCQKSKIAFLSTGFDIESVGLLLELGIDLIKIPSGEITNVPLLRHIGKHQKKVILSTGMATMEEVESAVLVLEKSGQNRSLITILHCNTEYPTPFKDVNLMAMLTIRDKLGVKVGYSDHTMGIEIPIAAVALGASIIEKHFTLDRNLPGPDHLSSIEPPELIEMVKAVRNVEVALGNGYKEPSESELQNILIVRKSIVAACGIRRGEVFSDLNLTVKRPGNGISPFKWDDVIGLTAKRDYNIDEFIEW